MVLRRDGLSETRDVLLAAALPRVEDLGWSERLLKAAAQDTDVQWGMVELAFPRGAPDLLEWYSRSLDERLRAILAESDLSILKIRERVTHAVRVRIELMADRKLAAQRAAATLALPNHAPLASRLLYSTVDAVWRGIDDPSTDFNFYSKRTLLAGVYGSTLLHWFADESPASEDTWAFLDRRIADVMQIEKAKARFRSLTERLPSPIALLGAMRYPGGSRRTR